MSETIKKSLLWSALYAILELVLVYALLFLLPGQVLFLGFGGLLYLLANLLLMKYNRDLLFINGIVNYLTVIPLGILLGVKLIPLQILVMGGTVSLLDVLSFTRYGRHTTNARVMAKPYLTARLIVYGKGAGGALYPTCGIGDYFHFALWLSGLSRTPAMLDVLGLALLAGNGANNVLVLSLYKKPYYKGIPATILPFLCLLTAYSRISR